MAPEKKRAGGAEGAGEKKPAPEFGGYTRFCMFLFKSAPHLVRAQRGANSRKMTKSGSSGFRSDINLFVKGRNLLAVKCRFFFCWKDILLYELFQFQVSYSGK